MTTTSAARPWHQWYDRFAETSTEVQALRALEPGDLPEWAIKLRQEFPTVPPNGVEMCHARWLETLNRLMEDIGDQRFSRRSHWCGDIPLETVAGLGLRRRILQAWLKGVKREDLQRELTEGLGKAPDVADLLYDMLGEARESSQPVRQDIEVLADMFSGPFEAGNAPILAKWRVRYDGLRERNSILSQLGERYFPVLTNLCNYRTLTDVDRLIGMVARQTLDTSILGPCNWSLKFVLEDEPERMTASLAAVWALHQFAANEFHDDIEQTPLGVRDQVNAMSKRLGVTDPVKGWLAATLGFLIKKWVRRAWHIMEITIPDTAVPDFSFPNAMQAVASGQRPVSLKQSVGRDRTISMGKDQVIASSSGGARKSKAPAPPGADAGSAVTDSEIGETPSSAGTRSGGAPTLPAAAPSPSAEDESAESEVAQPVRPVTAQPNASAEEVDVEVEDGHDEEVTSPSSTGLRESDDPNDSRLSTTRLDRSATGVTRPPEFSSSDVADPVPPEADTADDNSADDSGDWEGAKTIGGTTRILTSRLKTDDDASSGGTGTGDGDDASSVDSPSAT